MALPRKGSRKIVIEGIAYGWYIRSKPTYCQSMGWTDLTVAVQEIDLTHTTRLVINMPFVRPDSIGSSEPVRFVSPSDIARCIQDALKSGWIPNQAGSPFQVRG